MTTPKISIIMPVYNAREYLLETVESVRNQTCQNFEVICVDDGSTDDSVDLLKQVMQEDDRFRLIHQNNAGAGAARNYGFSVARGEYVIFLDSDDLFSPLLLEKLYEAAVSNQADIAACNFSRFDADGNERQQEGVHTKLIPVGLTVFSYRDCPDTIMGVVNPTPWNKLYRSEFIRQHGLKFEEISSTNDITFSAVSVAAAERVTYVTDSLVRYRIGRAGNISSTKTKNLNNIKTAVLSAMNQARALPHGSVIENSILSFVVDNLIYSLSRYIQDFSSPQAAEFYQTAHEIFNQEAFAKVESKILVGFKQYLDFCTVRKHDYEMMKRLISRRMIVSLTTYPRRIGSISKVLETIYAQTRQADEIVLWLAESQFPGKEADLPQDLLRLVSEKRLTIRWCNDLKAHKKYFYALQEYSDDLVVTIDDDLLYSKYLFASLYSSYLLYPEAVSTARAHLIVVTEQNQIMPYHTWIQETDSCIHKPSMQLLATGGAGVLYPPNLFRKEFFDEEAIMENCPLADDLWLKAMELLSGVPVVLARPFEPLRYLPGSQEEALYQVNVTRRQNDVQLQNISLWLDKKFEPGILIDRLTSQDVGEKLLGVEAVSIHLDRERKSLRQKGLQLQSELKAAENRQRQAENRQSQAQNKLRQTETKLRQTEQKLLQTEQKLRQTEQKLCRIQEKKAAIEAVASFGGQYRELGELLKGLKATRGVSVSWCFKYSLYLIAWIPAKLMIAITYYLKNGFTATAKRIFQKLFRRG